MVGRAEKGGSAQLLIRPCDPLSQILPPQPTLGEPILGSCEKVFLAERLFWDNNISSPGQYLWMRILVLSPLAQAP